jgi:hypothetical protein
VMTAILFFNSMVVIKAKAERRKEIRDRSA